MTESWTGYQVAWQMARGYPAPSATSSTPPSLAADLPDLPLGLVDWRRPRRVANLDLLVLLAFGVSH